MPKSNLVQRRSAAEWNALVEACARSGMSRRAFAEAEGLQPQTFAWWATRLSAKQSGVSGRTNAAPRTAFVPVRVSSGVALSERSAATRSNAPTVTAAPTVEVILANGRRVRFSLAHASDARLVALFSAAEGCQ